MHYIVIVNDNAAHVLQLVHKAKANLCTHDHHWCRQGIANLRIRADDRDTFNACNRQPRFWIDGM